MTHCNIENISALIDGELPETDAARLRGHLQECPSCNALYQDLSAMREGFAGLEKNPPDTLARGIMYKIDIGAADSPQRFRKAVRSLIAVAACLVAVLVVSKIAFPEEPFMPLADDGYTESAPVRPNEAPIGAGGETDSGNNAAQHRGWVGPDENNVAYNDDTGVVTDDVPVPAQLDPESGIEYHNGIEIVGCEECDDPECEGECENLER
jgi:hypothetical protein